MQHIQLTNDHIILQTSKGPVSVTRESFNYVAVQRKLAKGCTEGEILPLLETPPLPEGKYRVYIDSKNNKIVYVHYTQDEQKRITCATKDLEGNPQEITPTTTFVGMYASMSDIAEDWPEYTL